MSNEGRAICDAIVVSCIDFRFQRHIRKWIDDNLKNKTFDYVSFAGSTKDITSMLGQIRISHQLHNVAEVILIHHENCGAYGDKSTKEHHEDELRKAKNQIIEAIPSLRIHLYYVTLAGKFEKFN